MHAKGSGAYGVFTARSIGGAPKEIRLRHIGNCLRADPDYGRGVARR